MLLLLLPLLLLTEIISLVVVIGGGGGGGRQEIENMRFVVPSREDRGAIYLTIHLPTYLIPI